MDLIDELNNLSSKVSKQRDMIKTEEATKNAFVMPFIRALGYNVFEPTEVTPELTADIGTKKGEKVDYAILQDGKPIILFECKWCGVNLDKQHKSQLYRYFSVTEARFGVLTNGIIYRFYTDLDEPNKMDAKPFMEFSILDVTEVMMEDLKKFSKSFFSLEETLTAAIDMKYTREIKRILAEQMTEPLEDFVRFFASQIYAGKLTQAVKQQFGDLIKKALHQFVNERINERLKFALASEDMSLPSNSTTMETETKKEEKTPTTNEDKVQTKENEKYPAKDERKTDKASIVTTDNIKGYQIVTEILKELVDPKRVVMRDTISYCGILFDDNNRKPICRLYFNNPKRKQLGLFEEDKSETKVYIHKLSDISRHADRLKATINSYLSS
jgi:hypothetical protein